MLAPFFELEYVKVGGFYVNGCTLPRFSLCCVAEMFLGCDLKAVGV